MTTLDEAKVIKAIFDAVDNPENINKNGSINWNFVDADLWLDGVISSAWATQSDQKQYYEWFEKTAKFIEHDRWLDQSNHSAHVGAWLKEQDRLEEQFYIQYEAAHC